MIVFFSTVVRSAPVEAGGEIVKLDWDTKTVLARTLIVPTDPPVNDPNPRGGTRGGRGVLVSNGEVFVASYHSVHVFDHDLNPLRRISNPLFANIHELSWDGEHIWSTSTAIDAAIKVDRSGGTVTTWWPREDQLVAARFGLTPLDIDKQADNRVNFFHIQNTEDSHVHLNAAAMQNGRPLMLLNQYGTVVRLNPTEVVFEDPCLKGSHNILVTRDGGIVINNTRQRNVEVFDSHGQRRQRIQLDRFKPVRHILNRHWRPRLKCWLAQHGRPYRFFHHRFRDAAIARPVFVRGLWETPHGTILTGISPATILEIDLKMERLVDYFSYSDSLHVCVHGLHGATDMESRNS